MDRKQRICQCFQRGESLVTSAPVYRQALTSLLQWLIDTDEVTDDQTTQTLGLHTAVHAVVVSKQSGIVAGVEEVCFLLENYTNGSMRHFQAHIQDGDSVGAGTPILSVTIDSDKFLPLERTILNILGRMSGIATKTQRLIELTRNGSALIAGTRKAPWTLIDKKAIFDGRGLTHRLNLSDGVLIKDNHLKSLQRQSGQSSVIDAIQEAIRRTVASSNPFFEIEVEGADQGHVALATYEREIKDRSHYPAMILMLDNFDVPGARAFIEEVWPRPVYDEVLFEASGDITEQSAEEWAHTGVDVISLGALTHSVKNFNVSMALD